MADYNSELPIRSQLPGQVNPDDVIVKLGDATNPATQQAVVDVNGSQATVIKDASGNAVTTEANGAFRALDVMTQNSGSAIGGTAASFSGLAGGIYNTTPPTLTNGQQAALQLDAAGRLLVDAAITSLGYDTNYGTVGANTLRTASQIGNATGAANFGAGATTAQTLRVAANTYDGSGNSIGSTSGALNVSLTTAIPAGTNIIGSVNQGTSPWIVQDLADGSATGGTAGTFSMLAGGIYNSTPPTLTNGQQASLQFDSAGRLLTDANVTLAYDENYGTVGASTLRTAAQIGNATGAADFNFGGVGAQTLRTAAEIGNATGAADFGSGAFSAQTLRVVIASNQPAIAVTLPYDENFGTVGATTLRTAAQIGNATGAADFNSGATGAQTLRTVANQGAPNTAANAWPIAITSGGAVNSPTNPIFVTTSDVVGTPVNSYQTVASLAKNASTNMDYTVSAAKTFYTDQIWATASGKIKVQVEYETAAASGVFNTFWVAFNSTAETNICIPVPNEKTQVTGARIRIVLTNVDNAAMDVYSTLSGTEQ